MCLLCISDICLEVLLITAWKDKLPRHQHNVGYFGSCRWKNGYFFKTAEFKTNDGWAIFIGICFWDRYAFCSNIRQTLLINLYHWKKRIHGYIPRKFVITCHILPCHCIYIYTSLVIDARSTLLLQPDHFLTPCIDLSLATAIADDMQKWLSPLAYSGKIFHILSHLSSCWKQDYC